jgi:hypothetical protein
VEKKFMSKNQPDKVESFIKKDENLFFARGHLPYRFWLGILIHMVIYIGGGGIAAYFCFKRSLVTVPVKNSTNKINIEMKKGETVYVKLPDNSAINYLYSILSGKPRGFEGKILIDGIDVTTGEKNNLVFLCRPDNIPGEITVNSLLNLFKGMPGLCSMKLDEIRSGFEPGILDRKFNTLEPDDQANLLFRLALLKESKVYLFQELMDQCSKGLTLELEAQFQTFLSAGCLGIYASRNSHPNSYLNVDRFIVITKKRGQYESGEIS